MPLHKPRHPAIESHPVLATGHQQIAPGTRMTGAIREWVFGITLRGTVRYGYVGGVLEAHAGDVVIMRPGAPQSWHVPEDAGVWECLYCIFSAHPHMLPWLQYPVIGPGYMCLHLHEAANRRRMVRALLKAHHLSTRTPFPDRAALAMAAIEEALLWCRQDHRASSRALDPRVERALALLARRAGDPALGLPDLVLASGASRARFMALFHHQTGLPPMAYLEQERLRRARQLLETGLWQVKAVAAECGYADSKYFARRFRAVYGHPPSASRTPQR